MVVVGLGGAEGALEAYEQFFNHVPKNCNMAFVMIHIDDSLENERLDTIQGFTKMDVFHIEDEIDIQPNCVYIVPPNKYVTVLNNKLKLENPSTSLSTQMPIDYFFKGLANHLEEFACVIFSGKGIDGTLGIKEIKKNLGIVMVQEPSTCKYDNMPVSVINTGFVDVIATPEKLPSILNDCLNLSSKEKNIYEMEKNPEGLKEIHMLLKKHTEHDFSFYKQTTFNRRIERRMNIHQIIRVTDYVKMLSESPVELDLLFQELLIGVTSFFRDYKVFESLKEKILFQLSKNKPEGDLLRIWIPGCSTGEEVYSIAILIFECLDVLALNGHIKIQIFATDINENALNIARQGIYSSNISADISSERLEQFFTRIDDNQYQIKKVIRENIIFAVQNIITDPPFTKLDMLCCRNLFIYFLPELQKDLLHMFYYSLKPEGILLLGTSETIGDSVDLFSPLHNQLKIYKRLDSMISPSLNMTHFSSVFQGQHTRLTQTTKKADSTIEKVARKVLIKKYAPASVIINRKGDIIYLQGRTGKYLEPPQGKANMNIFTMARGGLRLGIDMAVNKVLLTNEEALVKDLIIDSEYGCNRVDLIIMPLKEPDNLKGLLMVIFEEKVQTDFLSESGIKPTEQFYESNDVEVQMEFLKRQLQGTISEMAASQENSRLVMEELQSTNEEMQSTNEELTTSKEELQSLNEELIAINAELQVKNEELVRSDDDVKNLLNSTDLGILFLNRSMVINRFTKKTTKIFNLIQSDVGRCITDITINADYKMLENDVNDVLETLIPKEMQLQTKNKEWYNIRILPYRTNTNVIDGVIITITDVSLIKKMEIYNESSRVFAEGIISTIREGLLVLDSNLMIMTVNQSFYNIFKVTPDEVMAEYVYNLGNGQWDIPQLRHLLEDILENNSSFNDYIVEHKFPLVGYKKILLNARKLNIKPQNSNMILLVMEDVTNL